MHIADTIVDKTDVEVNKVVWVFALSSFNYLVLCHSKSNAYW